MTATLPPPSVHIPDEAACKATLGRLKEASEPRVVVVGNPNVGKTTLINAVAGTRLKVGNWSGVTIEKREARLEYAGRAVHLLDLPGAYSLSPHTPEELIARTALLDEAPDAVLNVLDAGNLERNLYLTLQLLDFRLPVAVALNLVDEARNKGMTVDAAALSRALGVPVTQTVASRNQGTGELMGDVLKGATLGIAVRYPPQIEAAANDLTARMVEMPTLPPHAHRYLALALLEGDPSVRGRLAATGHSELLDAADAHLAALETEGVDPLIEIAEARYARAGDLARLAVPQAQARRTLSERLDRLALHPVLGIPIFLALVLLVFRLTFSVASPFVDLIGGPLQTIVGGWAAAALAWFPLGRDLVVGAIIPGVGTVLSFLPTLLVLYLAMSFLEDSGYMARAAFLMDRAMRSIGLDGRAFIPLILGFGCNVPAIYATRALERRSDRVLVSMILPFMSCSARLPVYVVFAAALFPRSGSWLVWSMYVLGMAVAFGFALILRRTTLPAEGGGVLLELPPYRFPAWKVLWKHASRRTASFARRARTTVMGTVAVVWLLLALPAVSGEKFATVPPQDSLFGTVSRAIAPIFAPLGFGDWQATGALIPGFVAKEVVVGTLGQIYLGEIAANPEPLSVLEGVEQTVTATWDTIKASVSALPTVLALPSLSADAGAETKTPLAAALATAFTPASALAYLVFVLLYTPCIATVGAMAQEHGRRLAWATVGWQMLTAWVVAFAVYQVAVRLL
ncbi:ferrous iron transport protein B [Deinococcus radiopugnans]|uniref:Ferrous iron transport protein B n=1 Tax=Deinococcus radiopugnans ATCC 19172 TaxID=585398 RepID=A0A5C4Y1F8_9DEIO|nr:ferrous iron transport protein B [Deinococcus radiopugnans]MBB6017968.1 ferrous iron transport protein B [Deinococcus radiopugnans ATCC 19172]TNM68839.1 ferrous iron transport protein B [Deinococcus radiopugnans ATCC 19172]